MARKTFDEVLKEIEKEVIRSGNLAKEAVLKAVESLKKQDRNLAKEVYEIEDKLDLLNLSIEDECMKATALYQPVAKDLRFIASMLRISEIFERIGDYSLKIAEITEATADKPLIKPLIDVPRMAELIAEMIDIDLNAIESKSTEKISELPKKDDIIDALYEQIYKELLLIMIQDPKKIEGATHLLFVARYLERIGDLAGNVGARIIFMIEGRRVLIK